jgi:hypothetical protein
LARITHHSPLAGQLDDVLWGNQDGVDQQTNRLGETRSMVEWFQRGAI